MGSSIQGRRRRRETSFSNVWNSASRILFEPRLVRLTTSSTDAVESSGPETDLACVRFNDVFSGNAEAAKFTLK